MWFSEKKPCCWIWSRDEVFVWRLPMMVFLSLTLKTQTFDRRWTSRDLSFLNCLKVEALTPETSKENPSGNVPCVCSMSLCSYRWNLLIYFIYQSKMTVNKEVYPKIWPPLPRMQWALMWLPILYTHAIEMSQSLLHRTVPRVVRV